MPRVLDVADRRGAAEEVGLELRPAMMVLARGFDRTPRVEPTFGSSVHIGPATFVCGERHEELRDAELACHGLSLIHI
eukprot:2975134-Prymnesium_polylepis.1